MTFTEEIKTELSGPLNSSNVKERKNYGGGGTLSYLESWFVIQEANRIFGFDGWTRETLQIERVATTPYNKDNREMMAVSYMARVRVTVGDIVREGCGYGDGQASVDKAGSAHELALKEAESDAMKRAFMTFGNLFGLALYDKQKANVETLPSPSKRLSKADARNPYDEIQAALAACDTLAELGTIWTERNHTIKTLPVDWEKSIIKRKDELKTHFEERKAA